MSSESWQVEVASGHLVAGDRPVGDGPVDFAAGQGVAVRGGDPRVEDLVAWPHGDHHGVAAGAGGFADELGEDAVLLADGAARVDPGQVAVPPSGRDDDGTQADDHGGSPGEVVTAGPAPGPGGCEPVAGGREAAPGGRPTRPAPPPHAPAVPA